MNYITVEHHNIINGPGLRTVLWVSGCSHHCSGCHNPETWNPCFGNKYIDETKENIIRSLKTARGLSISGGDPLYEDNREEILELCREIKEFHSDKDIWVWSGYTYEEIQDVFPEILNYIDVLVDGRFEKDLFDPNLKLRGSSNQRIIDIQQSLEKGEIVLYGEN